MHCCFCILISINTPQIIIHAHTLSLVWYAWWRVKSVSNKQSMFLCKPAWHSLHLEQMCATQTGADPAPSSYISLICQMQQIGFSGARVMLNRPIIRTTGSFSLHTHTDSGLFGWAKVECYSYILISTYQHSKFLSLS